MITVVTNGCFDLVSANHVRLFEYAKSLGDRLIVAVNSDASVRRLKGDGRPINTLSDRMAVLRSIRWVDEVVSFDEDTPAMLYSEILPDVLCKGGDYQGQILAGAQFCAKAVIAPLFFSPHSSEMARRIEQL